MILSISTYFIPIVHKIVYCDEWFIYYNQTISIYFIPNSS